MDRPLISRFPSSHHQSKEENLRILVRQKDQKPVIRDTYSGSLRTDKFNFQRPGPGVIASGTETETRTSTSEKKLSQAGLQFGA